MKKTGKIILLLIGFCFCALGIWNLFLNKGDEGAINSAVYLDEPKVLSENEGKLIIISGNVELVEPVYDAEKKLTINTPHAVRQDEEYKMLPATDENSNAKYEWDWGPTGTENLVGKAKLGEFDIDKDILLAFDTSDQYKDFKSDEISKYSVTKRSDKYHITSGVTGYHHSTTSQYVGHDYEGDKSFSYRYYDLSKKPQVTLIGTQKGNTIVKPDGISTFEFEGIQSKESLIEKDANSVMIIGIVFAILGVICVFFGLRMKKAEE